MFRFLKDETELPIVSDPNLHPSSDDRVARLSPEDEAAVDALIDAGFDLDAVPAPLRRRAEAARSMFRRLEMLPDSGASEAELAALADATLLRIDRHEEAEAARLRVDRPVVRERRRLTDFVAIAAVFILAVSLSVPLMSQVRASRGIAACDSNLRLLAGAMGGFAGDHEGSMPFSASLLPGGLLDMPTRYPVGGGYRHGEQLRPLVAGEYLGSAAGLRCPNHPDEGGTYSYRIAASRDELMWERHPRLVIVGDRNPVIELILGGQRVRLEMCSPEHDEQGQNVLYGDGATAFLRDPRLERPNAAPDNIWLPPGEHGGFGQPVEAVAGDVFLLN